MDSIFSHYHSSLGGGGGAGEMEGGRNFKKYGKGMWEEMMEGKEKEDKSMPKDLPKDLNSKLWNQEPVTDELGLFDISYK